MTAPSLLQLGLASASLALLASCEGLPNPGGYGGGYDDRTGYSNYSNRPAYNGSVGGYYESPRPLYGAPYAGPYGGRPRYYSDRDYRDHRYDHNDRDHRDSSSERDRYTSRPSTNSSHSQKSSSSEDIRLVKVRDGTRGDIPEGYHSKEWYQQRGISLSKNVYETREGERRGYSAPPAKSSSSSKKKKD